MARQGADWKSLQLGEATGVRSRQIADGAPLPLNSARSDCLDDKGKSDAAQVECPDRGRCIVLGGLRESLFVLYCILDRLDVN